MGLKIEGAELVEVNDSTFRDNDVGVECHYNPGNSITFWNNNFLWNDEQVSVDSDLVDWYLDRRGNYWSDYTGPDADGDGIGDVPYNVTATDTDEYPLMDPVDLEDPTAVAGPDITVRQHIKFQLDGTASHDDTWLTNWSWAVDLPGGPQILDGEEVTFSIAIVGTYQVTLTVTDALGKTGTDSLVVTVTDSEPPAFRAFDYPATVNVGDVINISCEVTDNVDVVKVVIDITLGSASPRRLDLTPISDDVWSVSIEIPLGSYGEAYFTLYARDAEDNNNMTDYIFFRVQDVRPPRFVPDVPPSVNTGDAIHLNCTVTDNWGVVNATVDYWLPDGPVQSRDLTSSGTLWSTLVSIPLDAGTPLRVRFHAMDLGGNLGSSPVVEVNVSDDDPPELAGYSTSPSTEGFHKGGTVRFEVTFTDNIGIGPASVEVRYYQTEWEPVPLEEADDVHRGTVVIATDRADRLWFRFNASDLAGNMLTTGAVEVHLWSENPVITSEPDTEVFEGALYNVQLAATDPDNDATELNWSLRTNASWLVLDPQSALLHGVPAEDDIGVYVVNLTVKDGDGGSDWLEFQVTVLDFNFPPVVEIQFPGEGAKAGRVLRLYGQATDDDDVIMWVRLSIDEGDWVEVEGTSVWNHELGTDGLEPGVHSVRVVAYDGVSESEAASLTFVVPEDEGGSVLVPAIIVGIIVVAALVIVVVRSQRAMKGPPGERADQ